MLQRIETALPNWLWSPQDEWSRWKGFGRIVIFLALLGLLFGVEPYSRGVLLTGIALYGIGLLGMRMELEARRKGGKNEQ